MPTRKYEWSNYDIVASEMLDKLIAEANMTNVGVAEFMNDSISYNRVRDIRKRLKAPARLTEFLDICKACQADPIRVLKEIINEASKRDNKDDLTAETDSYRAMHVSDLGLAAKHGDVESEQEAYESEP